MRRTLLALLLCLPAMVQPSAARAQTPVEIPPLPVPGARMPSVPIPATFYLPPGTGKVGAIILLHGCGGLGNGHEMAQWAGRALSWGYAALVPDSMTPRGHANVCAPDQQQYVTGLDRSGDVIDAALWLSQQPRIDQRIAVIGFSHGGGTAVTVTRKHFQDLHPGLIKASVAFYGPCRAPQFHGTTPLLALAGTADNWGNPAETCAAFGAKLRPDQPFKLVTYPGVVHAFDNDEIPGRKYNVGHPMMYSASATADSIKQVQAFLAQWMP
jgi:dienelactone hydrolase